MNLRGVQDALGFFCFSDLLPIRIQRVTKDNADSVWPSASLSFPGPMEALSALWRSQKCGRAMIFEDYEESYSELKLRVEPHSNLARISSARS